MDCGSHWIPLSIPVLWRTSAVLTVADPVPASPLSCEAIHNGSIHSLALLQTITGQVS